MGYTSGRLPGPATRIVRDNGTGAVLFTHSEGLCKFPHLLSSLNLI